MTDADLKRLFADAADAQDEGFTETVKTGMSEHRRRRIVVIACVAIAAALCFTILIVGLGGLVSAWLTAAPGQVTSSIVTFAPLVVFLIVAMLAAPIIRGDE